MYASQSVEIQDQQAVQVKYYITYDGIDRTVKLFTIHQVADWNWRRLEKWYITDYRPCIRMLTTEASVSSGRIRAEPPPQVGNMYNSDTKPPLTWSLRVNFPLLKQHGEGGCIHAPSHSSVGYSSTSYATTGPTNTLYSGTEKESLELQNAHRLKLLSVPVHPNTGYSHVA